MKLSLFASAALIAALTLPVLLFAAGNRQADVLQIPPQLVAHPGLKLVSEQSPYMRTER